MPAVVSGFTLGLDLGDRQHHFCVLDATGQIVREASLPNTRPALAQLLADFPRATVALAAGTHRRQRPLPAKRTELTAWGFQPFYPGRCREGWR